MGLRASLGTLVLELAANTARLQSDLGKAVGIAERAAGKLQSAFKFAGGGLLGATIIGLAKQSIEFGDSINKAAVKAGIGAKAMSELAYAAKLGDVDVSSLSTALKKMQVALSEAGTGAKAPKDALEALGLTFEQLQKRKPEAQFELIGDRISKLTDPADKARAATDLFGKAGADLLPLFEQGAEGIAKARAEAEKLGLSFNGEQLSALAAADDSIKRLDASWHGFATTLTAAVAPALADILDQIAGLDTRSTARKISKLQSDIGQFQYQGDVTPGSPEAKRRAAAVAELARLQGLAQLEELRGAQTGTSGGPQSRSGSGYAAGYGAANAADAAAAAAKKARDDELKAQEKFNKEAADLRAQADQDIQQDTQDTVSDQIASQIEYYNKLEELRKEDDEKLKAWREQQATQLSANAQIVKDAFMTSWDAWFQNGKFRIDDLFKYIIVEFERRGLAKLFDSIFLPKAGGGAGGGDFLDKVFGAIGGLFGGGRANGGSVERGKIYKVNENTPRSEWFAPGMSGSILRNGSMGGGIVVAPVYNIDARGATVDLIKALPRILQQNNRVVKGEIAEDLRRNRLGRGS